MAYTRLTLYSIPPPKGGQGIFESWGVCGSVLREIKLMEMFVFKKTILALDDMQKYSYWLRNIGPKSQNQSTTIGGIT